MFISGLKGLNREKIKIKKRLKRKGTPIHFPFPKWRA